MSGGSDGGENPEGKGAGGKGAEKGGRWLPFLAAAAVTLAGFLLYRTLSNYSLDQIVESLKAIPMSRLWAAGGFAAASYACLTGFDFLALRYVGRPQPYPRTALASFTSLSLGHNIGLAALSSGAIRYRFYSRWGLSAEEVTKLILFCGLTVGLGLLVFGGLALLLRSALAEEITGLNRATIIGLGATCLALALVYLALAAFVRRRLTLYGWSIEMPPLRMAIGQVVLGPVNVAFVAACLHQALAAVGDVPYLGVAAVYVIANVAALVSHVPGGLGVIESVVIFLLPGTNVIGALIVFRFVYFLVPLVLGSGLLLVSEIVFRRTGSAKSAENSG